MTDRGPLFQSERIILIGGPGGVGKTTLAAATSIALAEKGHRVLVLTVDPARRLAQALGLGAFSSELQKVALPAHFRGELTASQLDTRRYFDRVIERLAASPEQKEKILNNPIYQTMVESLGGTHEYAAMERLYEFSKITDYDRIVVDTPPTQNAVELLQAPERLANFMDNSVLRWFQGSAPGYLKLFKQGTKLAMKLLQGIFGAEFLGEFSKLMDDFDGMQAGFKKNSLEILEVIRSPETAFLFVTVPSELRFLESCAFAKTLEDHVLKLKGMVLNQIMPDLQSPADCEAGVRGWFAYEDALRGEQKRWVAEFETAFPVVPMRLVASRRGHLHDIESLCTLGQGLLS